MADVSVESAAEALGNGCEKAEEVQFVALKPKLVVPSQEAEEALLFYKEAFGAKEVSRVSCPKRKADQELPSLICAEIRERRPSTTEEYFNWRRRRRGSPRRRPAG